MIRSALHSAQVRSQWRRAVCQAKPSHYGDRWPVVIRHHAIPVGDRLLVGLPKGSEVADLEHAAARIAGILRARSVRVGADASSAGRAWVTIVRRDPLAGRVLPWPNAGAERLSLWKPIPVGMDEDGHEVTLHLPERNVLIGGEPGAGKSAALSLIVATAALDPGVRLTLLDGKLVELAEWSGCAEKSVGVSVAEACGVLRALQREMEDRYRTLLSARRRKVEPGDRLPLHLVVCDELAHYLTAPDRKQKVEFAELMRDLVSRGRAAGIIVVGATQKPGTDIIPSALRDLFGFRWALRCSTPQASDTILGQGWASQGYNAGTIDGANRGVGYLLHEGGKPQRLRAYYLADDDLRAISDRAEALRGPKGPAPPVVGR